MEKLTNFFTNLMRKYLPDPFVFAIGLTLLTMILSIVVEGQGFKEMTLNWGNGFWDLLAFTAQMAVILAAGYVLATSPLIDKLLNKIASKVRTPKAAIIAATLVGGIGCYLNWGFGLVIGSVMAKKLAMKVKGVHYPLIIASAYSGFPLYGLGLSASIPVLISTPGHPMEKTMGVIPLSETIFSPPVIMTSIVLIITLPMLNAMLHPKRKENIIEINPSAFSEETAAATELLEENTLANKLNNSRLLSFIIGIIGIIYVCIYFYVGHSLNLNIVNFIILFLGILLLGSPAKYIASLNEGIKTISGIILQYPFYAGIMAIMTGSGLVNTIAKGFVHFSSAESLPFWGLISSFFINYFAPSAGGHWVVQGPFMIDAAKELHSSLSQTSMSVMLGSAWNDLVQPFWLLPALAISKLKLKDVMGYTVVMMFWVGIVYIAAVLVMGYLF
ncbi:short-chain fatty acid transporter [Bacillus smithii]|uniref:short-chain fatty acid transporter n=1 Tax=Bacillus smithii TaxID=1479 RepID=UPI002E22EF29|nr:TIGR00366 family protein [Bacillus smithii]